MPKKQVNARIDAKNWNGLKPIAKEAGRSNTNYINRLLADHIKTKAVRPIAEERPNTDHIKRPRAIR
jgi:hypothetical protein